MLFRSKILMDKLGLGWSDGGERKRRWRDEMMKLGLGPYTTIGDSVNYGKLTEGTFINPNDLFYPCVRRGGCVTFFFMDGEMKKYDGSEPHHNILMRDVDLSNRIEKITGLSGIFMRARLDDSKDVLLGRYGEYKNEIGRAHV